MTQYLWRTCGAIAVAVALATPAAAQGTNDNTAYGGASGEFLLMGAGARGQALHQDQAYLRVQPGTCMAAWLALDRCDEENGCMQVVPRTHDIPVLCTEDADVEESFTNVTVPLAEGMRPVPVIMEFGFGGPPFGGFPKGEGKGKGGPSGGPRGPSGPTWQQQVFAKGWGYAGIVPNSIQADNGAGLTRGIIGLCNKGQPRKPDDWGALRAWAWGASRALDYLETDKAVDAKRVGIEGVSRFGKAALVTMAYDTRFAVGLIASSGEGGTKLHRRNWGEQVENLTAANEYHWMAGNFLKYGTAESDFGSKTPGDLPVDSHQLIALVAPRPMFISHGVPERGDAQWLDHQGSFMAAIAAQPVYRLLGAKDLGRSDDYKTEKMPAVLVSMLDGQLAWRQHDGGQPSSRWGSADRRVAGANGGDNGIDDR